MGLYSERFHGLLTLSSEYFSIFPHGTCLLSVLWKYLALDRVYDLLSAASSSNTTLRKKRPSPHSINTRSYGSYTLHGALSRLSSGLPFVADLERVAEGFNYDLFLYATFRRRLGSPGGSALGSSLFGRPY